MKVAIGSDHRGFEAKQTIISLLLELGHEIIDVGCHNKMPCDYPDYAEKVGLLVSRGKAEKGILICGTGIGMSIAANKIRGVRAALVQLNKDLEACRTHNDANVLCTGAYIGVRSEALHGLQQFLGISADQGERHRRRVGKINAIEEKWTNSTTGTA